MSIGKTFGFQANRRRTGFSLIEVVVTMTILAVLISFSTPSLTRAIEQSHADLAGAGLRSVASAQRFYWLENRTYATNLQTLIDAGLIDTALVNASPRYQLSIEAANASTFRVTAQRRNLATNGGSGAWQGSFVIDEASEVTGNVTGPISMLGSRPNISPSF